MGRLIDADKLLNAFGLSEKTRKYGGDHSGYDTRMLYEIQDTIEDAAEVEAIPVDWIKRYMKEVGLTDVKYMLETWEKEQIYGKTD